MSPNEQPSLVKIAREEKDVDLRKSAIFWIGADGIPRILDASVPDPAPPPEWASPEAIRGEPCDERSDLYTLAAILYGVAQGEMPFGTDPIEDP